MNYCFGILTIIRERMVGNCAIFAEVRESGLDWIRFDNRSSFGLEDELW
jgi:hypothetical protein